MRWLLSFVAARTATRFGDNFDLVDLLLKMLESTTKVYRAVNPIPWPDKFVQKRLRDVPD